MSERVQQIPAWTAVVLLALGPLIWVWLGSQSPQAAAAGQTLRGLGRMTGSAGLAWLLLAMMLSIRLPGFDRPFGGLLKLWRIHHWLGAASFVALLLHPVLLSLAAVPGGPQAVVATLTPPAQAWPVWSGWAALLLMMVFLAPSFAFFGAPDYQRWKAVHLLSAGAALLGTVHAMLLVAALPAAQAYWLWGGYGALAGFALVWRKGLSRLISRRAYRISAVEPLAPGVVEVSFEGPPLRFRPGQFVYLTPLDPRLGAGRGEEHPYAIVSAAQETSLRIAIKNLGDASAALLQVSVGSRALIEGPYGSFLPAHYDLPALWIGGGIGLTPFVSAARSFAAQGEPVDVQLIYCANDLSRAYFLEELEAITVEQPGFAVHAHFFAEQGPLSLEFLRARVPDFAARRAFVCGPAALLTLVRRRLREAGVPRSRISTEAFDLL